MDIDAIARKVFPELYADDEGKGRLYALEQVEDVLDAAGVPEREKRLKAAEKVCEVAKGFEEAFQRQTGGSDISTTATVKYRALRDALREWEASCLSCDKRVSCEEVCQELEVPTDA